LLGVVDVLGHRDVSKIRVIKDWPEVANPHLLMFRGNKKQRDVSTEGTPASIAAGRRNDHVAP
jgi:hypothetical protein